MATAVKGQINDLVYREIQSGVKDEPQGAQQHEDANRLARSTNVRIDARPQRIRYPYAMPASDRQIL